MKSLKALSFSLIAMIFAFWLVACSNEGPAENAGEEVDEAAEQIQDTAGQMTEEAQDSIEQAGDAIEEETDNQ